MRPESMHFTLSRQTGQAQSTGPFQKTDGCDAPGQQPGLPAMPQTMPIDSSILYLGETCVFDITLNNQGAPVSALTLKLECSVEGGSTAVLFENADRPLQQLPYSAQVTTDIKEQGRMTIVASAVFTDQTGERKYHVQFFKFTAASPVSVRTRVRHLPHVLTPATSSSSSGSSSGGCGVGTTRCFLEVNVQNSTQLAMQLHAVRLLAAAGVAAQQIAALGQQQQQQQQHAAHPPRQRPHESSSHRQQQHDQEQGQQQLGVGKATSAQSQLAPAGAASVSSSDTELLQDIDYVGSSSQDPAAPSVQQKQQQHLHGDQSQQQQQQPHLPGQTSLGSATSDLLPEQHAALLPAGCSHNSLWQIDHHLAGPAAASSSSHGTSGPSSSSGGGGGSSTLGRLELHWSTCDGRTGRLLTQPLTGPVPASGKEVLMQLYQLVPQHGTAVGPAAAAGVAAAAGDFGQPGHLATSLAVNQPFTATFTLTAGPHDMGPLLVLYTSTVPPAPSSGTTSSSGGLSSSGSAQLVTDSSSIQARRFGAAASSSMNGLDAVAVQGSRSIRVPGLAAGQSVTVAFQLLPLRRGWLRLPTFVVASEADGRLVDGVHDIHVLVV